MKIGTRVYDCWWPWRTGKVIKHTATRLVVEWDGGKCWSYDKAHQKFLRKEES